VNELFSPNGVLNKWLNKIYQIVFLHFLFVIFSIPLVTVGAANTALYTTWFKIWNHSFDGHMMRTFWEAFKKNFKKATILWGIILWFTFIVVLLYPLIYKTVKAFPFLSYVFLLGLAIFLLSYIYLFPLLARFENTIKHTFINSFMIGMSNMPYSILLVVVNVGIVFALPFYIGPILFLWLATCFGLVSCISSWLMNQIIFKKYVAKVEKDESLSTAD
jgi:uncharacterized membrane protein YesL